MLSRAVSRRHLIPRRADGEESFLRSVERVAADGGYEVVFGCSDAEILSLSRARDRIAARVPHSGHVAMMQVHDKVQLAAAARRSGIAAPPSAASAAEALRLWGDGPAIVKERVHAPPEDGGESHLATLAFPDAGAADERVRELEAAGAVPMVQPLLEGSLLAFTSVIDADGEVVARVQQVAERTYPRDAGLSSRARTVTVDETIAAQVTRLLRDLGWFGLSQIQFIVPADGPPVLLDFNGRFYGSLALALAAGVNLPDTWARLATNRPVREAGDARPDVPYQWLEGDLRSAREHANGGARREVVAAVRYGLRGPAGIFSISDPLPGVVTAGTLLGLGVRTAAKRRKVA
jgi:predicted ATP-grasp superfamily ATP-dependent carboligase